MGVAVCVGGRQRLVTGSRQQMTRVRVEFAVEKSVALLIIPRSMSAGGRAADAAQDRAAAPSDDKITAGSSAGGAAAISGLTSIPDDSCQSRARFFGDLSPAHYQVSPCFSLLLLLFACLSAVFTFICLSALLCLL